jgi:hypothetical protein
MIYRQFYKNLSRKAGFPSFLQVFLLCKTFPLYCPSRVAPSWETCDKKF